MPQLDFSFYISQITWLLVSFGCFLALSRFWILPKLEQILQNRANLIEKNTIFAKEKIELAKKINEKCEEKIVEKQQEINEKIAILIKQLREYNDKKLCDLKKKMLENENNSMVEIKIEMQKIEEKLNEEIIEIVSNLLEKVYFIKPERQKLYNICNKLVA